MFEFFLQHKSAIEEELKDLYGMLLNAGVGTQGDIKNRITLLEKQLVDINKKISDESKKETAERAEKKEPEQDLRIIKLFLASSNELKREREEFEIFINRENKRLIRESIFIELDIWEDFTNVLSINGLQKEYNDVIKSCDLFVSLFYTKAGSYTREEFEVAFEQFEKKGKPLIYTYFRNYSVNKDNLSDDDKSLLEFKTRLRDLKHYLTTFQDIYDLKYQFKMQLDKILQ